MFYFNVKLCLSPWGKNTDEDVWQLDAVENIWTEEEVTEGWRKLHNEELHNFYFS
jgi:hypothetical protein